MPPALIPIAIGAAAGGIGSALSGAPKTTTELDPKSQEYVELQRQFGTEAANAITGFDPATGQFWEPSIGPITEQFDMESINRFLSPFLQEQEGQINSEFDISRARDVRGARQESTLAGTGRGSRGAVLESLAGSESDRNRASALTDLRVGGFGQAFQGALQAQPFRNLFAREPLDRLQAGQGLLTGGFGQAGTIQTGPKPSIFSGIAAGATLGAGFAGGGGGGLPGSIPVHGPPPAQFPGTNLAPGGLLPPPQLGRRF